MVAKKTLLDLINWWAQQDSNLQPRDSRTLQISLQRGLSLHPGKAGGCGTLLPVIKGAEALR